MKLHLIEPDDTLFFRNAIPMSAGQGRGAGCRMPWPNTVHEAFRATLVSHCGGEVTSKGHRDTRTGTKRDRARAEARNTTWSGQAASKNYGLQAWQSLRVGGPFPYLNGKGILFPTPMDATLSQSGEARPLALIAHPKHPAAVRATAPRDFIPPCLAAATSEPDKHLAFGWWTAGQFEKYLGGGTSGLSPILTSELWQPEYSVGVSIDPSSQANTEGGLFAGTYLRPRKDFRLAAFVDLKTPEPNEEAQLKSLNYLLLGGQRRQARLERPEAASPIPPLPPLPAAPSGSVIVHWMLITPAVFTHGWLPGWVCDSSTTGTKRPLGQVCLPLPNGKRAWLIAAALHRAEPFSGWDSLDHAPKPTQLAVPAGSSYYFLCEDAATAQALATKLHWPRPRSDFYGEKGFGLGFCRYLTSFHPQETSLTPTALLQTLTQPT